MRTCHKVFFPVLPLALFLAGSCGFTKKAPPVDPAALLLVASTYGQGSHPSQVLAAARPPAKPKTSPETLETEEDYMRPIKLAYAQLNYDELEKMAHEARDSKGRTLGGIWKIFDFFVAINQTYIPEHPDESDLKLSVDSAKDWVKARPGSAAARISLAQAYQSYGRFARGAGYANSVTSEGWRLLHERMALSAATLEEAAHLKDRYPFWFDLMQTVALEEGWNKSQARQLMELAVAFEPGYYHFYREHAYYLLPRWYGEPGDLEAFANEISDRVGGLEGDMLYFEFASLQACLCDAEKTVLKDMSWSKIQRGYAAIEQLYGVTKIKMNRFASMAVKEDDKQVARAVFAQIGEDWNDDAWVSKEQFDQAKAWANQ